LTHTSLLFKHRLSTVNNYSTTQINTTRKWLANEPTIIGWFPLNINLWDMSLIFPFFFHNQRMSSSVTFFSFFYSRVLCNTLNSLSNKSCKINNYFKEFRGYTFISQKHAQSVFIKISQRKTIIQNYLNNINSSS